VRTNLQCRRIASYCLNAIIQSHHLGQRAITLQSDQPDDWDAPSDWEIFALVERKRVAEIYLIGEHNASIIIPSWYDLVRSEHIAEFEPAQHNIEIDHRQDPVTREKFPDADLIMTYSTSDITNYDSPEMTLPRTIGGRRPKVIASR
jgi:hypothetical protein